MQWVQAQPNLNGPVGCYFINKIVQQLFFSCKVPANTANFLMNFIKPSRVKSYVECNFLMNFTSNLPVSNFMSKFMTKHRKLVKCILQNHLYIIIIITIRQFVVVTMFYTPCKNNIIPELSSKNINTFLRTQHGTLLEKKA